MERPQIVEDAPQIIIELVDYIDYLETELAGLNDAYDSLYMDYRNEQRQSGRAMEE